MEENVALCSDNQKHFVKSIQVIKKLVKAKKPTELDKSKSIKNGHIKKKKAKGLVYLSHIPHGFYEHEMTEYFKQFGVVTNARVIKSKKTGRSKGCAFVEFKEPAVAQIASETMNNYLMGKRLIKASCIPPELQRPRALRKHWNPTNNPGTNLRKKLKKAYNQNKDEKGELKMAKKILSNLEKTKKKLKDLGIDYDFFQPVDTPQVLIDKIVVKKEKSEMFQEDGLKLDEGSAEQKLDIKNKVTKKEKGLNVNFEIKSEIPKTKLTKIHPQITKSSNEEKDKVKDTMFKRKKKSIQELRKKRSVPGAVTQQAEKNLKAKKKMFAYIKKNNK